MSYCRIFHYFLKSDLITIGLKNAMFTWYALLIIQDFYDIPCTPPGVKGLTSRYPVYRDLIKKDLLFLEWESNDVGNLYYSIQESISPSPEKLFTNLEWRKVNFLCIRSRNMYINGSLRDRKTKRRNKRISDTFPLYGDIASPWFTR